MMRDNGLFNEYMLAYRLGIKHSDVMTMSNKEYLGWQAYAKRCGVEGLSLEGFTL